MFTRLIRTPRTLLPVLVLGWLLTLGGIGGISAREAGSSPGTGAVTPAGKGSGRTVAPSRASEASVEPGGIQGADLEGQSFWQELIDILTGEGGSTTGGKGSRPCLNEGWTLEAPLGGGHRVKPDVVRWGVVPGAGRYEVTLSDLMDTPIWTETREASPDATSATTALAFPEAIWSALQPDQSYRLRVEARDRDGHRIIHVDTHLWRISEGKWQTFEQEVPTSNPKFCQDASPSGLDCAAYLAIARGIRAMSRQYYAEALSSFGSLKPLKQTFDYACTQVPHPPSREQFTKADKYAAIVLNRAQTTICLPPAAP